LNGNWHLSKGQVGWKVGGSGGSFAGQKIKAMQTTEKGGNNTAGGGGGGVKGGKTEKES